MAIQAKKRIQFMIGNPAISKRQVKMVMMGAKAPPANRVRVTYYEGSSVYGSSPQVDAGEIGAIVDGVIAANPAIVAEYRAGKERALHSLVGKAMAASSGKANPAQVNALLKQKLG